MSQLYEEMTQGLSEAESFMKGERNGFRAHVPSSVDVKEIRGRLGMSQERFSRTFGFSVDAVRHWESRRRTPEASTRAFLKVIAKHPRLVMEALAAGNSGPTTDRVSS